jgi:hypothetical protein
MGNTLNGQTPSTTFPSLIKFSDNSFLTAALRQLSDGNGNDTPLFLSTTQANLGGTGIINSTLGIKASGNTAATTSFRVENNNNSQSMYWDDSGKLWMYSAGAQCTFSAGGLSTFSITSLYSTGAINLDGSAFQLTHGFTGTILNLHTASTQLNKSLFIGSVLANCDASAQLELNATDRGLLLPRMTTAQRDAIVTPANGLLVYNSSNNVFNFRAGGVWKDLDGNGNSIVSNTAAINTTETVIVKTPTLSTARLIAGTVIAVQYTGTCTTTVANVSTFKIRIGTAGTIADTLVFSAPITAAASGTAVSYMINLDLTIRTIGATATAYGTMVVTNTGVTGISTSASSVIIATMTTFDSTAANIISGTLQTAATTTTHTIQQATINLPIK